METIEAVKARIAREGDVAEVVNLRWLGGHRYRYFIRTPFETWPKFVIGVFYADTDEAHFEFRCGHYDSARDEWQNLNLLNPTPA